MTDSLRVILEIGKKRRVVAGAMDWPGLDRWGTSEDGRDREAGVVSSRGTPASPSGPAWPGRSPRRATLEVVERVPGLELDRLLGHRPRAVADRARGALVRRPRTAARPAASLLGVLRRRRGTRHAELRPGPRSGGRSRDQIIRHVYRNEPEQFSHKVEVRTPLDVVLDPGRPRDASAGVPRRHPRLQRRGQAGADAGRSSSSSAAPPTT